MRRHVIARELGSTVSERLQRVLDNDEDALRRLYEFFENVRELYRGRESDDSIPLHKLPDRLRGICQISRFPGQVDFSSLEGIERRIASRPYWDTFFLGIQGALLAIRRDRDPRLRASFAIDKEMLEQPLSSPIMHRLKTL